MEMNYRQKAMHFAEGISHSNGAEATAKPLGYGYNNNNNHHHTNNNTAKANGTTSSLEHNKNTTAREELERKISEKYGIQGHVGNESLLVVNALYKRLESQNQELVSCKTQIRVLKNSNERLLRENDFLIKASEKKDRHIKELQAEIEQLLLVKSELSSGMNGGTEHTAAAAAQESNKEKDALIQILKQENEALNKERSLRGRDERMEENKHHKWSEGRDSETSIEIKKHIDALKKQVGDLQKDKEHIEQQLQREKSEAAKKFEELVSSVQASVSTITNERDQLRKQNSQATELLKRAEEEKREQQRRNQEQSEELQSIRSKLNLLQNGSKAASSSPSFGSTTSPTLPTPSLNSLPYEDFKAKDQVTKSLERNIRQLNAELEQSSLIIASKEKQIQKLTKQIEQQRATRITRHKSHDFEFSSDEESDDGESEHQQGNRNSLIAEVYRHKKEQQRLEREIIDLKTALTNTQAENERLKNIANDRSKRFDDYHELQTALRALEHKYDLQSDTLETREKELERLRNDTDHLTEKEKSLHRKCQDQSYELASLKEQLKSVMKENESLVLSSTEIKNGCNKAQMKLEKRKTKILHLRQVLKDKERENEELLVNNRRLNDLNNFLKRDVSSATEETGTLSKTLTDYQNKAQQLETLLRSEQQRSKRLEDLLATEREKTEETQQVKQHLERLIKQMENTREELSLLQRNRGLQENEIQRLRKENEALRYEKEKSTHKMRDVTTHAESLQSTVDLQSAALSRLEEDKDQLRGYVCKYEAELSKNEATVAQLVADLNEMEEYARQLEEQNSLMEQLIKKINSNVIDRDRLIKQFDAMVRTKRPPPVLGTPKAH